MGENRETDEYEAKTKLRISDQMDPAENNGLHFDEEMSMKGIVEHCKVSMNTIQRINRKQRNGEVTNA